MPTGARIAGYVVSQAQVVETTEICEAYFGHEFYGAEAEIFAQLV
jgi:hypothetical protein